MQSKVRVVSASGVLEFNVALQVFSYVLSFAIAFTVPTSLPNLGTFIFGGQIVDANTASASLVLFGIGVEVVADAAHAPAAG